MPAIMPRFWERGVFEDLRQLSRDITRRPFFNLSKLHNFGVPDTILKRQSNRLILALVFDLFLQGADKATFRIRPMFEKLQQRWEQARKQRQNSANLREDAIRALGAPVFKKYGIEQAILFGSVSRGHCHDRSDIDLWVRPLAADNYWQCKHDLEEEVGFPIDLHTDTDRPDTSGFRQKIIERGKLIYEA